MPTKKPDKKTRPKAYAKWVAAQLQTWDPADDRGGPDVYVPRLDGVRAADVEGSEDETDS
jgi:hypothetical protein